jgi:hypothetical protein
MSMIENFVSGYSAATFSSAAAHEKPATTIGLLPSPANLRSACSRCASLAISNSRYSMPV